MQTRRGKSGLQRAGVMGASGVPPTIEPDPARCYDALFLLPVGPSLPTHISLSHQDGRQDGRQLVLTSEPEACPCRRGSAYATARKPFQASRCKQTWASARLPRGVPAVPACPPQELACPQRSLPQSEQRPARLRSSIPRAPCLPVDFANTRLTRRKTRCWTRRHVSASAPCSWEARSGNEWAARIGVFGEGVAW